MLVGFRLGVWVALGNPKRALARTIKRQKRLRHAGMQVWVWGFKHSAGGRCETVKPSCTSLY